MLDSARDYVWAQLKAVKPAFVSKKPHFNFISVHCPSNPLDPYGRC